MESLKDLLENAQLTQSDYAKLLNVSRVTVHAWCAGKAKPHKMLARRVEKLSGAIQAALEEGSLPLGGGNERADRIRKVLSTHLAAN